MTRTRETNNEEQGIKRSTAVSARLIHSTGYESSCRVHQATNHHPWLVVRSPQKGVPIAHALIVSAMFGSISTPFRRGRDKTRLPRSTPVPAYEHCHTSGLAPPQLAGLARTTYSQVIINSQGVAILQALVTGLCRTSLQTRE